MSDLIGLFAGVASLACVGLLALALMIRERIGKKGN